MCNIERLGDLLIKKGLLSYSQVSKALEFQAKLNEKNYMPLGEILINFGYITREGVTEVLNEQKMMRKGPPPPPPKPPPPPPDTSKAIAGAPPPPVNNKINLPPNPFTNQVSAAQVNEGARHRRPIGEILIEKGFVDRATLSKALQYQAVLPPTHHKPIGEILVELGYINREQLDIALGVQPPVKENFLGEILKSLGIIDDSMLSMVLMLQHSTGGNSPPVGELLVQHGFITREQLEQGLAEQKRRQ